MKHSRICECDIRTVIGHNYGAWYFGIPEEPEPQPPAIMPLEFDGRPVRIVTIGGEPWWVAKDVCGVLGIGNVSDAVRGRADRENDGLDEDEYRDIDNVDVTGRTQQMLCVNESGLYSLVFKSRKPDAKRFRKWVTSEVLPSIRRTGRYVAPGAETEGIEFACWLASGRSHASGVHGQLGEPAAADLAAHHLGVARRHLPLAIGDAVEPGLQLHHALHEPLVRLNHFGERHLSGRHRVNAPVHQRLR